MIDFMEDQLDRHLVEDPDPEALDPEYVWHEVAQIRRSPQGLAAQVAATPEVRARHTMGGALSPATASWLALGFDATLGETVLRLYRAAPRDASTADARVVALDGPGHWWLALPDQLPAAVAALTAR
ncbi:hypothetical protein OM076_18365 [Solirubrobacter ginsenosidimutans]|uniref:Alpha/beta hydrolase n=1 Tax=Solirubrobacter ginsenosidimutans TaxID=490573 RepID=A0A9X3MVT3_9ACTN|nr:hypothetical protein [Solirubrobacter ginsenosidimutans]MDA0162243.1 hypothetical protein [Solirubrobacter ginsenosidimutans]